MYGLKEHGYSRPDTDLFEGVARVVETVFTKTQRPVPGETVIAEMGKQRRELQRNSVMMALAFNDRVESVGHSEYVPAAFARGASLGVECPQYDIDAAFDAFSFADDCRD